MYSVFSVANREKMLVIPAIDLKDGCCVRLSQGEKDRVKVYDQDPAAVAEKFAAQGAERLHLVDLDGAFTGGPTKNLDIAARIIRSVNIPVQFGGGVRSEEAVKRLVDLGADRIILGTIAVEDPKLLDSLAALYGSKLAVGIDARNGRVAVRGWETETESDALELALRTRRSGIERIIYTDISMDGMLAGPNIEAAARLARESRMKTTASGGIGTLDDLRRLKEIESCGIDSCIIGKALYESRFTLREAILAAG